jgi:hypothetical protein
MDVLYNITRSHFKVFSAICSNFVVVWLIVTLAARDPSILLRDLILVVVFLYLAIKSELVSEENEQS